MATGEKGGLSQVTSEPLLPLLHFWCKIAPPC